MTSPSSFPACRIVLQPLRSFCRRDDFFVERTPTLPRRDSSRRWSRTTPRAPREREDRPRLWLRLRCSVGLAGNRRRRPVTCRPIPIAGVPRRAVKFMTFLYSTPEPQKRQQIRARSGSFFHRRRQARPPPPWHYHLRREIHRKIVLGRHGGPKPRRMTEPPSGCREP